MGRCFERAFAHVLCIYRQALRNKNFCIAKTWVETFKRTLVAAELSRCSSGISQHSNGRAPAY